MVPQPQTAATPLLLLIFSLHFQIHSLHPLTRTCVLGNWQQGATIGVCPLVSCWIQTVGGITKWWRRRKRVKSDICDLALFTKVHCSPCKRVFSPELPFLGSGKCPSLYSFRHRGCSPEVLHYYPLLVFLNIAHTFTTIPLINLLHISQFECAMCYLLGPHLIHTPGHHHYYSWVKMFCIYMLGKQIKKP